MDSLVGRWKTALHQAEHMKNSLVDSSKRDEDSKKKGKELLGIEANESKASLSKETRTRSNDGKKISAARQSKQSENKRMETPSKKGKKHDRLIENCTNAILEVSQPAQPDKVRSKIKSLLQDLLLNAVLQKQESQKVSMMKDSVSSVKFNERAYSDLQTRYFQCQKERQYLRGKMEMMAKRYEHLQREVERYTKIQKLVDNSIAREAEMRHELARVHSQKQELERRIEEQQSIFSQEVQSIRQLIETIKTHLPIG